MPQLSTSDGVFLVDDGSTDGTTARVRATFSSVHVIEADGSLFWAKGMHKSWSAAVRSGRGFDHFLWLNDDVMLKPDAIAILMSDWTACADEMAVLVGACSDDEQEKTCSYGVTDICNNKIIPNGLSPQKADGWLNGNVVLVPFATYVSIGMISDEYTHARADYDYAERLKRSNVSFLCSSTYVGICRNDFLNKMDGVGLLRRVRMLWNPGSLNLMDLWRFRIRHYGYLRAMVSCVHLILIVIKGM